MLYEIRETDAEASIISEQQTTTGDNFHQKKSFSRSQPRTKFPKTCSNCLQLESEICKLNNVLTQMRRVESLLLNQVKDIKHQLEESQKTIIRSQKYSDDINKELKIAQDKAHTDSMNNGLQSKLNIELRRTILKMEQDTLQINKALAESNEELQGMKSKYLHEHKFIESLLHMVMSCHPDNSFREPPSLKQAWKWLKMILADYMTLKQQCKRIHDFQESSGQSSSSTNK